VNCTVLDTGRKRKPVHSG